MGLFWDYFKRTLRLAFIQHPGPLAMLAEGAAALLDTVRDVVLQLRDQFLPFLCEDVYLARFARSRGIVRNPLEPDDHWQARVRFAYNWWIRGGRPSAMSEALRVGFGFVDVKVINMASAGEQWAEFKVIAYQPRTELACTPEQVLWAINEV